MTTDIALRALLTCLGVQLAVAAPGTFESAPITIVSAASFRQELAPSAIASVFGFDLAHETALASSESPLPESLLGTAVKVTDNAGTERVARLYFVSPTQINFVLPDGTIEGPATVTVVTPSGSRNGSLVVKKSAPALFTANGDGTGVPSATFTRVVGENVEDSGPVYRFDARIGRSQTAAIPLLSGGDNVFVSLYGTGFRHATALTATVANRSAAVTWYGPHSQSPGLDQVNVHMPTDVLGRGIVEVTVTADDVAANPVVIEFSQAPWFNLRFETDARGKLWGWSRTGEGYTFETDASVARSGGKSMRIRYQNAAPGTLAWMWQQLPPEAIRGKRVRFSGYVKSDGITRGEPRLYITVRGPSGLISYDRPTVPTTSPEWHLCTVDHEISPEATEVQFGLIHTGDGTAWYDDLAIEVNGGPYREAPPLSAPSTEQVDWVRANAIPLVTAKPASGFDDLEPLRHVIGNARIVALGEATHGTSEFFRMKHRMVEFLATRMGFTVFAIEANMPEAYRLNDYVLTGRGDPLTLLQGMYYWTWNTQEVLDLILWMREFNRSGKGRIQFTGFDMQNPSVAMSVVSDFIRRSDTSFLPALNDAWALVGPLASLLPEAAVAQRAKVEEAALAARTVLAHLEQNRSRYRASAFNDETIEWAVQNARIVQQAMDYKFGGGRYRDVSMSVNMEWILRQNPGAKAIIWAHNAHVAKIPEWMGYHLAQRHGNDYRVFGFVFHAGGYNALDGSSLLRSYDAVPSYPGTVEYVFHSTGIAQFVLDLAKATRSDPASGWLAGALQYREIGSLAQDGFQATTSLLSRFDALMYFDETSPSTLLPFR